MENKIDLNDIMEQYNINLIIEQAFKNAEAPKKLVKRALKEAIRQALVLVPSNVTFDRYYPDVQGNDNQLEENQEGTYKQPYHEDSGCTIIVNKQSILDIEKLIIC